MSVQKTGGTSQSFAYDAYGDLTANAETAAAVTAMTYDLGLKLTGIDAAGTANDATFTFDAIGRFRTRVLAGSTDTYSYVGAGETVTRIANSVGGNTDSIVSPSGDRLGVRVGATLNWFLPDPHGNIAASLDSAETTVVNAIRYDAYGQTILTGSAGGSPVGQGAWKYQGRLDISPTGLGTPLYDLSARFYSPGLGAFSQLDSVMGGAQDPLGMNRFLYAQANPATLIDPTGHQPVCPDNDCSLLNRPVTSRSSTGNHSASFSNAHRPGSGSSYSRRIQKAQFTKAHGTAAFAEYKAKVRAAQYGERETNSRALFSAQIATNRTTAPDQGFGVGQALLIGGLALAVGAACVISGVCAAIATTAALACVSLCPRAATAIAATGGAAAVRMGQAGEAAVRSLYAIGPKVTRVIGTRTRIFDGLNSEAVSEVKNVSYQAYTQQVKDSLAYAQQNGLRFDLYVRGGPNPTTLSKPLEAAVGNGDSTLKFIP